MTPEQVRERYTFEPGDRVQYYGMDMWGVVQSVWDIGPDDVMLSDLRAGRNYTVTWLNGQTTTVPAGYLLPRRNIHPTTELWLVSIVAFIAIVFGLAIPFLGWLCIAAPVAVAYGGYLQQRKVR